LPLPKSGRGYKPKDFILPLVLMLNTCLPLPAGRRGQAGRIGYIRADAAL